MVFFQAADEAAWIRVWCFVRGEDFVFGFAVFFQFFDMFVKFEAVGVIAWECVSIRVVYSIRSFWFIGFVCGFVAIVFIVAIIILIFISILIFIKLSRSFVWVVRLIYLFRYFYSASLDFLVGGFEKVHRVECRCPWCFQSVFV